MVLKWTANINALRVLTVPARLYLSSINQISWDFVIDLLNENKLVISLTYFEL